MPPFLAGPSVPLLSSRLTSTLPMPPHALLALAETGKAVLISQNLEKLLSEMFEFRKLHQDFDYAKTTGGEVPPKRYKDALMNGVKSLREQSAIHPTLDAAVVKYIEGRHVLVHRWALEHGFPDDANVQAWTALASHARSVSDQAQSLFGFISKYLAAFAMPDLAARDYPAYEERMLNMFNREYPGK